MRTINRKNMIIYIDSNLIDIETKNKIIYKIRNKFSSFLLLTAFDKYTYAKQTLAPAAKILAPVYVGESENQPTKVTLLKDHKINERTLD